MISVTELQGCFTQS